MTRHELVGLTLDQLIEAFKANPECFDLECTELKSFVGGTNEAIMWKHRVEVDKSYMPDPHNPARTVVVINNKHAEEIQCFIFMSALTSINNAASSKADADMSSPVGIFRFLDKNHKKFKKLKNMIVKREKNKECDKFLSKLYAIFPGTFDDHIFGKK
jgi:hypothetical protein